MKKTISALLIALIVLSVPLISGADDALYVNLEAGDIRDGLMYVMINTNARQMPDKANTVITLDGTPLDIVDVNKFSASGMKTSYMLLVDVSGSITSEGLQAEKAVAKGILDILSGFDNMAIMELGETITVSDFTSDKNELKQQINALSVRPNENTSVFGGIYQALDMLSASPEVHERRCLIVVTDGCDTVENGHTFEDTLEKIESAHIPLHVASLVFDRPRKDAEKLERLAFASPGGTATRIGVSGARGKDAANAVNEVNSRAFVLTCALDNIKEATNASKLTVSMNVMGAASEPDTILLDIKDAIAALQPEETPQAPTPTEAPASAPTTEETPTPDDTVVVPGLDNGLSGKWLPPTGEKLYVVLGAAALILCVAVLLVALNRKKRKSGAGNGANKGNIRTLDPSMPSGAYQAGQVLRLVRLGVREREEYSLPFKAPITMGSDPAAAQLVFMDDARLSPAHCVFEPDGKGVTVRDLGSGTMTFVNGVPIKAKHLNAGDEVIAGAYRFKIG